MVVVVVDDVVDLWEGLELVGGVGLWVVEYCGEVVVGVVCKVEVC